MNHPTHLSRRRAVQAAIATAAAVSIPAGQATAGEATPATGANIAQGPTRQQVAAAVGMLDSWIASTMTRTGVPGMAVAVVFDDEVLYERGFGMREVGGTDPVTVDTVFQLASMSKAISSTVMAAVVGDGTTTWDTVAADALPGFALSDPWLSAQVSLRDLFSHRSGLPAYAGDTLIATFGYGRDETVRRLRLVEPATPIRTAFAYTNVGLSVAGFAAAASAGTDWEDLAESRLLAPLGMDQTSYRNADYLARANRAEPHYRKVDGSWATGLVTNGDPMSPAGGVSASVHDLTRWVRMQLGEGVLDGKEIVARAALMETRRPQILESSPANPADGPATFYGLGWFLTHDDLGRLRVYHIGDFSDGFRTSVNLLPGSRLGIVALTNAWPNPLPDAVPRTFFEMVERGEPSQDWITYFASQTDAGLEAVRRAAPFPQTAQPGHDPALPLESYVGTFANTLYGTIATRIKDGGLVLEFGPGPAQLSLSHWSRDVFTYDLPPTGAVLIGEKLGVQFRIGPTGTASELAFGLPSVGPEGTAVFTRIEPGTPGAS
ncbi:MAG: serine hydrolase [Thermomicrobiales bacterium]